MDKLSLNVSQWEQLKEQYCEIVVDSMSTESLVEYVQWKLAEDYDRLSDYGNCKTGYIRKD